MEKERAKTRIIAQGGDCCAGKHRSGGDTEEAALLSQGHGVREDEVWKLIEDKSRQKN